MPILSSPPPASDHRSPTAVRGRDEKRPSALRGASSTSRGPRTVRERLRLAASCVLALAIMALFAVIGESAVAVPADAMASQGLPTAYLDPPARTASVLLPATLGALATAVSARLVFARPTGRCD